MNVSCNFLELLTYELVAGGVTHRDAEPCV